MKFTSLDTIVRGMLLQTKRPIHYYIDYLVYAQRCLEELGFDVLGNVRATTIPINSYFAGTLPCDFLDWVQIGFFNGQFVMPMVQRPGINRLNAFDNNGNKVPYPDLNDQLYNFESVFGNGVTTWSNTTTYNDHWENIGRMYGASGVVANGFKIIKERNEIQFDQCIPTTSVVLEYISDGSSCDNATQINPYAKKTIEMYIQWQYMEHARSYTDNQRREGERKFEVALKRLRSRMNPMTINDVRAIVQRNTHGSLK